MCFFDFLVNVFDRAFFQAEINKWAATWQNQQSDCAPSEDRPAWASALSDQSFAVRLMGS